MMATNNNKTIYIIIGVVVLAFAAPFVIGILVFFAGFLFYAANAN